MNDAPLFHGVRKPSIDFSAVRSQLITRPNYFDVDLSVARTYAANTHLIVPASGNFLYIDQKQNSGVAAIHFEDVNPNSTPITVFPGSCYRVPFTQLAFENLAQPGMTLRVIVGTDVQFEPSNAAGVSVLNSVSVVDGNRIVSLAGQSFFGNVSYPAVAAKYAHTQLWNPLASGKRGVVKKVTSSITAAAGLFVGIYNLAMADSAGLGYAKRTSLGAVSVLQLRGVSQAAFLPGTSPWYQQVAAAQPQNIPFEDPIILDPGYGLVAVPDALNIGCSTVFDWREE